MSRRQASLYLSDQFRIESLRLRYNPIQARLIPAHITLCREDEITDWDAFRARLEFLCPFEITLEFGAPVRDDDFVFLPVTGGLNDFFDFRRTLLMKEPRKQIPHITLIHPRNGSCTDQIFADISASLTPFQCVFREVMLVEQENDGVWNVVSKVGGPHGQVTGSQIDEPGAPPQSQVSRALES